MLQKEFLKEQHDLFNFTQENFMREEEMDFKPNSKIITRLRKEDDKDFFNII